MAPAGPCGRALSLWLAVGMMVSLAEASKQVPVAVLARAKGHVRLIREGKPTAPPQPCKLFAGDKLEVGQGGEALLIFPDKPPRQITARAKRVSVQLGADRGVAEGQGAVSRVWGYLLARLSATRSGGQVVSPVSRDGARLEGLWPCDTLVLAARPEFAWRPVAGAKYRLVIMNAAAREVWKSDLTTEPRLRYPDDAPALEPATRYWWQLQAATDAGVLASETYWIEVAPAGRAEEVKGLLARWSESLRAGDAPGAPTAAALLLAAEGFRGEALAMLATSKGGALSEATLERWREVLAGPSQP